MPRKPKTIQVKGAGPMVPGIPDPSDGYGDDAPPQRDKPWIIRWVALPIPMWIDPDGRVVVTSPPERRDGSRSPAPTRFATMEAAQQAIDRDRSLKPGECVPVKLADFEESLIPASRRKAD